MPLKWWLSFCWRGIYLSLLTIKVALFVSLSRPSLDFVNIAILLWFCTVYTSYHPFLLPFLRLRVSFDSTSFMPVGYFSSQTWLPLSLNFSKSIYEHWQILAPLSMLWIWSGCPGSSLAFKKILITCLCAETTELIEIIT